MALGLLILPSKCHLIRTGFSSFSKNSNKFHIFSTSRKLTSVQLVSKDGSNELSNYKEIFSKRMAMAGLKPHHPIAVGVSGGPDSMGLCLLAADWKTYGLNTASRGKNDVVDGLLAIIVDHGLRAESRDEAEVVQQRVLDMDVRLPIVNGQMVSQKWAICKKQLET